MRFTASFRDSDLVRFDYETDRRQGASIRARRDFRTPRRRRQAQRRSVLAQSDLLRPGRAGKISAL